VGGYIESVTRREWKPLGVSGEVAEAGGPGGATDTAAGAVAEGLVKLLSSGDGACVTWYNHYSVQVSMAKGIPFHAFTHIGIDGVFLRWLAEVDSPRTSADLVIPELLKRVAGGTRVALIGGNPSDVENARIAVQAAYPDVQVALVIDGYDGLPDPVRLAARIDEAGVDLVILGLGAPRQDEYALALHEATGRAPVVLTCGGWLDQIAQPRYYPRFAYPLRLNWLVRLLREPRRLWRRYTVVAVRALLRRTEIAHRLHVTAGNGLGRMGALADAAGAPVKGI